MKNMSSIDPQRYPETAKANALGETIGNVGGFLAWLRDGKGLRIFHPRAGAQPPTPWRGIHTDLILEWLGVDVKKLHAERKAWFAENMTAEADRDTLREEWDRAIAPLNPLVRR